MTFSSTCPKCGEALYQDDAHCPKCGARRSEPASAPDQMKGATRAMMAASAAGEGEVPTCSSCGAPRMEGDFFCAACGLPMPEEVAGTPPAGTGGVSGPDSRTIPEVPDAGAPVSSSPSPPDSKEDSDGWGEVRSQLQEATLGEFEIVKELGRGGMAAVFLARDPALGRNVAIKVMAPGLLMGDGMVDRFRQEAVTIANLNHPNIITIHTVRQAGNLHFFVMQEVQGDSLEGVLEKGESLPVALVQAILYQIGTGLSHAHRSGVIHRDIKPANVLMDREGNAILTDFGIAKVSEASNLTQTGSTIGTPAYMSPEQCLASELTNASDQYSLGVVAYEMLVGRAPFDGSPFAIMSAHNATAPPPIRDQRKDCPPELEAAVLKMLAKDPDERFPNVADAIEAIGGYVPGPTDPLRRELARLVMEDAPGRTVGREALTPIPSKTPVPTTIPGQDTAKPKARSRGRLPLLIGGGFGLVAAATAGIISFWPSGSIETPPAVPEEDVVFVVSFADPTEALVVGASATVSVDVRDADGQALPGQAVTWTSDDPAVATVEGSSAEAVVTGIAPGTTGIVADAGGTPARLTVEVSPPAVGELTVSASRRDLVVGEQMALTGILTDDSGERVPDPELTWSSSDPGIAQVDARSGVVTGRSPGRAQLSARSGDQVGRVGLRIVGRVEEVTIAPPADRLQAGGTVVLRAAVNAQPPGYLGEEGIEWMSSNPSVASVSLAAADSVVLTLLAEGETVLTAQAEAVQGAVTLRVLEPARAATLDLSTTSVAFNAMEGGEDPDQQDVTVTVTGAASATVGLMQYQGDGRDWLRAELAAGTGGTATLTLRPEVAGLGAGTYTVSLPITAGEDTRILNVQLVLAPNPATAPVEPNQAAEQGIANLLTDYASAINTKNTARVRELFPTISQDAIDDLLGLRDTDTYLLQLVPGSLRLGSLERTLDGDVMTSVLGQGNRGEAARIIYTFGRGEQGWYVVALRAGN